MSTREQFLPLVKSNVTISPYSPCSLGTEIVASANNTTPVSTATIANTAYFIPFVVNSPLTVTKITWYGSGAAVNVDAGIYTETGIKVISTGAVSAGTGIVTNDITDTYLASGRYYMAVSYSGVNSVYMFATTGVFTGQIMGCAEQTTAHPLPATATFATTTKTAFPLIFLTVSPRTVV